MRQLLHVLRSYASRTRRGARSLFSPPKIAALAFAALLSFPAWPAQQQSQQKKPAQDSASAQSSSQAQQNYDPVPAEKDVEVGEFYLHKGDVDAAIPRFQDAVTLKPNYAKARLLLAGAYEKKGEKATAAKCYEDYLRVFPTAPDAKKIRKKIASLTGGK